MITLSTVQGHIFGLVVGDALGIPLEFMSRSHLQNNPSTGFDSSYYQSETKGTWADDSSLSFCLLESIIEGYSPENLGKKLIDWKTKNYWNCTSGIKEIGFATDRSIERLINGINPYESGESGEYSNGNGALMRISGLVYILQNESLEVRFNTVKSAMSITHGHIRNIIAGFFLIEFMLELLENKTNKIKAFENTQNTVRDYLNSISCNNEEKSLFLRLFYDPIYELDQSDIYSSAYVIHTLETALWCFLNTNSYDEAVLKAINLGSDTDTSGSVTGALAGMYYGIENIPDQWQNTLKQKPEIINLSLRFFEFLSQPKNK